MIRDELNSILGRMVEDKGIKTFSLEFKRTTSGVKISYEIRFDDTTKIGSEMVNNKDLEKLVESKDVLVKAAHDQYVSSRRDSNDKEIVSIQ